MQDAGTNHSDHYRSLMGRTRFRLRSWILEHVRKETDALARVQNRCRTPFLDTYFATTANLGTHTFYMVMLPVFCWYGNMPVGESVITDLAIGVYLTGFVKDLMCLPRPRSPPLHRISTSGSATQEYGFPSTHSCNAVSVICIFLIDNDPPAVVWWVCILLGLSITLGRLYTGMHGFIDVGFGLFCGWISWIIGHMALRWFSSYIHNQASFPWAHVTAMGLLIISLVVFHPQPVDPCPCYDDSVAFLSVVFGIELSAASLYALNGSGWPEFVYRGPVRALLRFIVGVALVITWRFFAKRTLLQVLPPIWRYFETAGLVLPRQNYLKATQYDRVPRDLPDELLPDSPKQIASMIRTVRRTHGRSDSVGPQNIADVYEAEAYRQSAPPLPSNPTTPVSETPPSLPAMNIEIPRVRYDVEIVTKIVVYTGIAMTAAMGAHYVFVLLDI